MPAHLTTLSDLLRTRARTDPDRPFVRCRDRGYTLGEFDERTDDLAAGLLDIGIRPGDVVSVFLPNCLEFLEAWWAILKAGAVFGPVNPTYTANEAGYILVHSRAVAVITDSRGARVLEPGRASVASLAHVISVEQDDPADTCFAALAARRAGAPEHTARSHDDLASVLYTSGTTGRPKGAMLSHRNLLVNAAQGAELLPLAPGERVGMLLPLFHANAQVVTTLIPLMIGCEIVMWERFSASRFWQTVAEFEPVTISAVPTILAAVLHAENAPQGPTSLRCVLCGAAPLSVELLRAFQDRFGIRILEGYGLTETGCIASLNPFYGERKAGSIGVPLRGQEMEIRRRDGRPARVGERGEIVIKGPNVMAGYLDDPVATAESIRDGWLHTGDIGYVDEDGYFYIVDRSKDMIIRSGENIYPREIEEVLYQHTAVLECAVIGVPDTIRGEEVVALITPRAGVELDLEELALFASTRLAAYKLPKRFERHDALPKTPTGKISKAPLRERYGTWTSDRA